MFHVLIIEDDAIAALDIRSTLKAAGATSFAFADTESEAVDSAVAHPPGLITADVLLSKGSGVEAVRRIHSELGPLPVIYITGTPDQCDPCDPASIIEKPFDPRRLAQAFTEIARL